MPKRLVVCCDGTWNVPDEVRGGVPAPTNVAKLADGLNTDADSDQRLYYEPGVGTAPDEHLLGGAFGVGLSRNIRNAYRFLAESYEPGDKLYLFGFSRGAYTARSLAGLVRNCGVLRRESEDRVDEAFAFYRDRTSRTHPAALASRIFRQMYSQPSVEIEFIGVWDTVGALGIPDFLPGSNAISKWLPQLWGFHDTQLSSHVKYAYQALAIDERRLPFKPTLWTGQPADGQTVEQVWFAGVHSEVGGGSRDSSLSDIALLWMAERARECGIKFEADRLMAGALDSAGNRIAPSYAGEIIDSRKGLYALTRPYHRLEHFAVDDPPGQTLATSVVSRLNDPTCNYRPPGIGPYERDAPRTQVIAGGGTARGGGIAD